MKYRIVSDGKVFSVQRRRLIWPFWRRLNCYGTPSYKWEDGDSEALYPTLIGARTALERFQKGNDGLPDEKWKVVSK